MAWEWTIKFKIFVWALLIPNKAVVPNKKGWAIGYNRKGLAYDGSKQRWWGVWKEFGAK
jgi:hypothetical protein